MKPPDKLALNLFRCGRRKKQTQRACGFELRCEVDLNHTSHIKTGLCDTPSLDSGAPPELCISLRCYGCRSDVVEINLAGWFAFPECPEIIQGLVRALIVE